MMILTAGHTSTIRLLRLVPRHLKAYPHIEDHRIEEMRDIKKTRDRNEQKGKNENERKLPAAAV